MDLHQLLERLRSCRRGPGSTVRPITLDPNDPTTWVGLDLVHEQVTDKLKEQNDLWEAADTRLRLILGVISLVFAVALGLVPRGAVTISTPAGPVSEPQYLPFWAGVALIAGLGLYFLAGGIALWAFWPRDFDWPPRPGGLPK